ncbi:MAG: hypothetical protein V7774_07845 [Pseudorhizobium pelagicum]|uniref:DUF5983 family protein n=1 Tax=Pseudorhizobium pelagicum TaxID=1509405 RepID=UPI003460726E
MSVEDLLVISTAHLSDATCSYLENTNHMDWPAVGGPFGNIGFIFHVDETIADGGETAPGDLTAIFRYAADRGYFRVLLDNCGDPVNGLRIYRDR